jgi:AraC-like DNA-binding protein
MPPASTARMRRFAALPPLAFGARISSFTTDPVIAAEQSKRALPCLRAFEPTPGYDKFAIRKADIRVGELTMVANSASGIITKADGVAGSVFMFALNGNSTIRDRAGSHALHADANAILLKNDGPRETISSNRSLFIAKLNAQRLNETIATMFGEEHARTRGNSARLDQNFATRSLALRHGSFDFSSLFRRSFGLIDSVCDDPRLLDALRLDDMIYRNIALLLQPDLLLGAPMKTDESCDANRHATDNVCDVVRENTGRMLTLTEMENLSGLSRRALQYAFRKRFGVSPMEWQKNERLLIAHQKIIDSDITVNITTLSYDLGFSKPSSFAAYYRRLFGESPSETRLRARF